LIYSEESNREAKMKKFNGNFPYYLVMILVCAFLISGCGAGRQAAYLQTIEKTTEEIQVENYLAEGDEYFNNRGETENLDAAIKSWEKVLDIDPFNKKALESLAIACYWMANGHLEDVEDKMEYYHKGAQYGERCMALNPEFKALMAEGKKDYECLHVLGAEELPAVYWVYGNLGKWAVHKGFVTVLKYKSKLKAFVDWVAETDETFYYAAGHRGLGVFYAKAPSFAGGDLGKSMFHFERSLEIAPDYFGTKVLMAEYYAYKAQDRELFERVLNEVLAADPTIIPEVGPEQVMEQENARKLLEKADDMFE